MEILMIIIGVLAVVSMIAFLVHLFIKAINKDQQEQDERILQLEKRLENYKKETKENFIEIDETCGNLWDRDNAILAMILDLKLSKSCRMKVL